MAEMKFNCPKCAQLIACDELWSGHQIQCPTCQASISVPAQPAAQAPPAGKTLVPQVPQSAPRLSIGQARHAPASAPPQASATSTTARVAAGFVKEKKKGGGVVKTIILVLVFAACAVGGYFGFKFVKEKQDKANATKQESDGGEFGHAKALYDVLDATDPSHMGRMSAPRGGTVPRTPPPGGAPAMNPAAPGVAAQQPTAVVPPIYTLDTNAMKIPEGRVNGIISGTNFVADSARLDPNPAAGVLVLRFYQGLMTSPDRAILIYLRPKAGEKLAGHTWLVSADMKSGPTIYKMWKATPTATQPTSKTFSTGYVMDLEMGEIAGGQLAGKIFLALPDPEQTVIGGIFQAATKLPDTAGGATPAAGTTATPAGAAQARPPGKS